MRYFLLFFAFVLFSFFIKFEYKVMDMEFVVFEMYRYGFEEYLSVDEHLNLCLKKDEITEYLEEKGYKVSFYDDFEFEISFKYFINFSKDFSFYLEGNHESK